MDGNTARGASSPANPALHIPDPLSITNAAISSSAMSTVFFVKYVLPSKRSAKNPTLKSLQEAQLPQRDSASATHVFLGSLTDRALH